MSMPKPVFFRSTLFSPHSAGSGTLVLQTGDVARLGSLAAGQVYAVTAVSNPGPSETIICNFRATGSSGDTLTGVTADAYSTDVSVSSGVAIEVRVTPAWQEQVQSQTDSISRYVVPEANGSLSGSTLTFNCAANNRHSRTLAGNWTIALSGSGVNQTIHLKLVQASSGGPYAADLSGLTVNWHTAGAVAPVMPTTAGADMIVVLVCTATNAYDGFVIWPVASGSAPATNVQTGTTYTLALLDDGRLVTLANAAAITLIVPANASVAMPVEAEVDIAQLGAGTVTVTPEDGTVTILSHLGNVDLAGQYAGASLKKLDTNTWLLVGGLA